MFHCVAGLKHQKLANSFIMSKNILEFSYRKLVGKKVNYNTLIIDLDLKRMVQQYIFCELVEPLLSSIRLA